MRVKLSNKQPIKEVFLILSRDERGNEGIVAVGNEEGLYPLVSGDKETFERMKETALKAFRGPTKGIHCVRFSSKEELGPL